MTRKRFSNNKTPTSDIHPLHHSSEISIANSESLLIIDDDESPVPIISSPTTTVSNNQSPPNKLALLDNEIVTTTIRTLDSTDNSNHKQQNQQQRINTKSPISRIFNALSHHHNMSHNNSTNNNNTTTNHHDDDDADDEHHHRTIITQAESEKNEIILDSLSNHHHHHHHQHDRLIPVEHWHNFENIIANDILMIIAEFLDHSQSMVNLSHTCSMWFNFLEREQRFWHRLYQLKIRELKLQYFKDFDIYVQEKVVKRRILTMKNYLFNHQQNIRSSSSSKKENTIGQYHLNYLISNNRKRRNTKPLLLEGICKIENVSQTSSPSIIEMNHRQIDDDEYNNQSPHTLGSSSNNYNYNNNNSEIMMIEMDEFSNNSGASQTALIDHSNQLSSSDRGGGGGCAGSFDALTDDYISEEEEIEILTLINESDCDSEESTVQIPPSMFKKYKYLTMVEGVNDGVGGVLFEKDCFLECLKTERKVKQFGIDIFRKVERKKSDRFTTIPLSEQVILDEIEGLSAIHCIFSAPLIFIAMTCFVFGFSLKGILMNIGVDYENEWSWSIVFLPLYCTLINVFVSSIIELRLSYRKLAIALRNNSKRREKQRNIMFLRKMFFDTLMTSVGALLLSIGGMIVSLAWNLYLCLPHSAFSQSPWYLFSIFTGVLTVMLLYCMIWMVVRSVKFYKVISKLTSACNLISLVVIYSYVILCGGLIANQFSIGSEIDWSVALIPIFVIELIVFVGTLFIGLLWCCLEYRALFSKEKRCLYMNLYLTIVMAVLCVFIHHVVIIALPEQASFGYASLLLIPLPLILLPCMSCSIKYIDGSGGYVDLVK